MFTGIVDHVGRVVAATSHGKKVLRIETRFSSLTEGESICVDGVCLTVVQPEGGSFGCELSGETLSRSIAGSYEVGTLVNLERALTLQDRLGGHSVSGHVDSTATVSAIEPQGEFVKINFNGLTRAQMAYVLEKGSIAIQGTSLTINSREADGFSVTLIPHTLERTTLKYLKVGSRVNLEFDWMMKVICRQVEENLQRLLTEKGLS